MRFALDIVFALPLLVLLGCSDRGDPVSPDGGDDDTGLISYRDDLQPIWNARCVSCHGGEGGLVLAGAGSRSNLVGAVSFGYAPALRVVAGDPDASVLYRKLSGNADFGDRMPQGGVLPGAELAIVRAWVEEGALDN